MEHAWRQLAGQSALNTQLQLDCKRLQLDLDTAKLSALNEAELAAKEKARCLGIEKDYELLAAEFGQSRVRAAQLEGEIEASKDLFATELAGLVDRKDQEVAEACAAKDDAIKELEKTEEELKEKIATLSSDLEAAKAKAQDQAERYAEREAMFCAIIAELRAEQVKITNAATEIEAKAQAAAAETVIQATKRAQTIEQDAKATAAAMEAKLAAAEKILMKEKEEQEKVRNDLAAAAARQVRDQKALEAKQAMIDYSASVTSTSTHDTETFYNNYWQPSYQPPMMQAPMYSDYQYGQSRGFGNSDLFTAETYKMQCEQVKAQEARAMSEGGCVYYS